MLLRLLLLYGFCSFLLYSSALAQGDDPWGMVPSTEGRKDTQPQPSITRHPDFDRFLKSKFKYEPPYITCQELQDKLEKDEERIFILDARDAHEYSISHIPGARRIGWTDFSTERVWMYDRDALVVVYCSIGERSVRMAGFLNKMGFRNVRILYGSITEWANQGYDLWDKEDKNTRKVFFTDKTYAKFLKHGFSVFERT